MFSHQVERLTNSGNELVVGMAGLFARDDEVSRSISSIDAASSEGEHLMLVFPSALMIVVLGCRISPFALGGLQRAHQPSSIF